MYVDMYKHIYLQYKTVLINKKKQKITLCRLVALVSISAYLYQQQKSLKSMFR